MHGLEQKQGNAVNLISTRTKKGYGKKRIITRKEPEESQRLLNQQWIDLDLMFLPGREGLIQQSDGDRASSQLVSVLSFLDSPGRGKNVGGDSR